SPTRSAIASSTTLTSSRCADSPCEGRKGSHRTTLRPPPPPDHCGRRFAPISERPGVPERVPRSSERVPKCSGIRTLPPQSAALEPLAPPAASLRQRRAALHAQLPTIRTSVPITRLIFATRSASSAPMYPSAHATSRHESTSHAGPSAL